jgi:hypothetical protein
MRRHHAAAARPDATGLEDAGNTNVPMSKRTMRKPNQGAAICDWGPTAAYSTTALDSETALPNRHHRNRCRPKFAGSRQTLAPLNSSGGAGNTKAVADQQSSHDGWGYPSSRKGRGNRTPPRAGVYACSSFAYPLCGTAVLAQTATWEWASPSPMMLAMIDILASAVSGQICPVLARVPE